MESNSIVAFALGGVALALGAQAQQVPIFPGSEIVVTAGRMPQRLSDTLRNVVVITAADIEQAGQLTLAQVLQQFGGLEVTSNGGQGGSTSVFIRGTNSAHTLVLVDGIRLQSATAGITAFENIPLAQVERIEIVPGPASSLYGSDAIGGVIQIFTKGGRATSSADVTASVGSYGTRSVKGSASASAGDTDFTLSAGFLETDGFSATKPTVAFGQFNPDDDGYRNSNFSGKLAHRFDARNEAGASVLYSKGEAHFDGGPGTDDRTRQELTVYSAYSQNQLSESWQSLVRIGASQDDNESLDTSFPGRFKTDQAQATWQNTIKLGDSSLVAGVEYLRQKIDTTDEYAVTTRTIKSYFAGYRGDYGNHGVQASVRRDDNSQFGTPNTGSFAYGYRVTPEMRIRAAYGTAFHAPSFNDLYFPGFGNPYLQPERSRSREVGFDYQAARQRFSATYFDNRVSDLIVFVFDPVTFNFGPVNLERARIRGTELSYSLRFLETQLRAKLTIQDPQSDTGYQLQRRARRHGSLLASRTLGAWRFGAELVASGARFDSSNEAPASRMAGYALFNVSVARNLTPEWSVDLRWNNIGDTKYELVQGYNTPGSNVLVSLKWAPLR